MKPDDPLATLASFLDRVTDEVEARGPLVLPPREVRAKLDALAEGRLSPEERGALSAQIRREPDWIDYLASSLKQRLEAPESTDE